MKVRDDIIRLFDASTVSVRIAPPAGLPAPLFALVHSRLSPAGASVA